MKELISKELLSLILDSDINSIQYIRHDEKYIEKNCIQFQHYGETESLNKDTLGRLCKEWCNDNKYAIRTEMHYKNSNKIAIMKFYDTGKWVEPFNTAFETELEAIIKATEWVYENAH